MKKWLMVLMMLCMVYSVSADLIITPNPQDVQVQVNQPKSFQISLNNTFNFDILGVTFANLTGFTFPSSIAVAKNSVQKINFTVNKAESFLRTIPSKVSFSYIVQIPDTVQTHYINVTESGYNPNYLTIRQGDTVIWTNKDDITHSVTSATFDHTLSPNQTASEVFSQIGTVEYQDLVLFFGGTIDIMNRSSPNKAHNPNYDVIWNVNLNSILNPTSLDVSTLESSFEVEATGSTEDLMKLKNTGNELAERINLVSSMDWVSFETNNFTLAKGETKFVKYTIAPKIFNASETNQTYFITLTAQASNSEKHNLTINVSVPYSDVFNDFTKSDEAFLTWFANVYCPTHQNLFICNTSAKGSSGEPQVIYRDPEIPINLTATEVYAMLKRIQGIQDSNARTDNKVKEISDLLGLTVPQLQDLLNQSLSLQQANEKASNDKWDAWWIFFTCIIIAGSIATIVYFVRRYYSKKAIMEGS